MKKLGLIILSVFCFVGLASAQDELLPKDSVGVHPWDGHENDIHYVIDNQSHWSVWLEAGMNVFDGDFTSEQKSIVWLPNVGLGGHYHWNNTWGIGAEYKFRNYRVKGKGAPNYPDILLNGYSHQADGFISFDVFNAFRPQNKRKIFALDLIVGGGAVWVRNTDFHQASDKNGHEKKEYIGSMDKYEMYHNIYPSTKYQEKNNGKHYFPMGVFLGGVSAEFNINRYFQLGLRCIYNMTTKDELADGRVCGNNNDGFFDCDLLFRWKIVPREKSNVRNFMVENTLAYWNEGEYYDDPKIGAAKRERVRRIKALENPVQKDTLYIINRDTVFMAPSAPAARPRVSKQNEPFKRIRDYVVYFNNDKYDLDNVALTTIHYASETLKDYPNYMAVVVGSCDNTGAVEYNKWLAVQRSTNVTNTLIKSFGIDSTRIYNVGRGIMQDDRSEGEYGPNRRVEIRIVDSEGLANAREILRQFESNKDVQKTSAVRQKGSGEGASSSKVMKDELKAVQTQLHEVVEKAAGQTDEQKVENDVAQATTPAAVVPATDNNRQTVIEKVQGVAQDVKAAAEAGAKAAADKKVTVVVEEETVTEVSQPAAAEPVLIVPKKQDLAKYTDADKLKIQVKEKEVLKDISKQYYGNANCWVYIYKENMSALGKSTKKIPADMTLTMPIITKAQSRIDGKRAGEIYRALK